jgi:hypothetical protein
MEEEPPMSDDVRRVSQEETISCVWTWEDDPDGTHALMPWEEYERLRAQVDALEGLVESLCRHMSDMRLHYTYSDNFEHYIDRLCRKAAQARAFMIEMRRRLHGEKEDTDEGVS